MKYITFEQDGDIATVTICRPEALNALNRQLLTELDGLLDEIADMGLRCLIITGSGKKAFVAGADISEMKEMGKSQAREYCLLGNKVFRRLETQPVPVIAAVNGYALGGGCELMMAADIRLASEQSVFGQPEVGLGITPGFGGTQRLARLVGTGLAKELLFTARRVKADEAKAIGLVNAVYPADELMGQAVAMAKRIAANAPIAIRATKQAVNEGIERNFDLAIQVEAEQFSTCFETNDQREAMAAFVEKRPVGAFGNS